MKGPDASSRDATWRGVVSSNIFATYPGPFPPPKRSPVTVDFSGGRKGSLFGAEEYQEKDTFVWRFGPPERDEKGFLSLKFSATGNDSGERYPSLAILG